MTKARSLAKSRFLAEMFGYKTPPRTKLDSLVFTVLMTTHKVRESPILQTLIMYLLQKILKFLYFRKLSILGEQEYLRWIFDLHQEFPRTWNRVWLDILWIVTTLCNI